MVRVPPTLLAAFSCLREATAGKWSGDVEAAIAAFYSAARLGMLRSMATIAQPHTADTWLEAAEVRAVVFAWAH